MITLDNDVEDAAQKAAANFRIDSNLIKAIIMKESEGECFRPRYEPAFSSLWYPRTYSEKLRITQITEETLQKMSWGAMQIMGATARWQGFEAHLPMLCDAETGIFYGSKYLKWLSEKFGDDEPHIIAAYNAGPGVKKTAGGMWTNQKAYVDVVYQYLTQLRKVI